MELLQLRYFQYAARTQSFAATAKKFIVPASNISQSVRRLERELGVELFDRRANSISLNKHGLAFYKDISQALSLIDGAVADLGESTETIRICVNSHRRIVMQTIEKFRREFSEVDVITRHSYKDSEDFDLIISNDDIPLAGFVGEKILTEPILLALRADNPLASLHTITADDLRAQSFISMGENSNIYKTAERICREIGFEPHNVILADDPFYVRRCVELGLGIAFVPSLSWKGQFSEDIVFRSFGPFYRDTYVFKKQKKIYSKTFECFLSLLLEEFNSEGPTSKQISLQNSVE